MKLSLSLGVTRCESRLREQRSGNRVGEKKRGTGERKNGRCVERGPRANVANIPPKVLSGSISHRERDVADQRSSWVGRGEEAQKVGIGSRVRSGSEAQRGLSTRAVVVEAIVRLLLRDGNERGHLTIGRIAITIDCGGIEAGSTA